jgi:hypothetical protein
MQKNVPAMDDEIVSGQDSFGILRGNNDVITLRRYRQYLLQNGVEFWVQVKSTDRGDSGVAYRESEDRVAQANGHMLII